MRIGRTQDVIVAEPLVDPVPALEAPADESALPGHRTEDAADASAAVAPRPRPRHVTVAVRR